LPTFWHVEDPPLTEKKVGPAGGKRLLYQVKNPAPAGLKIPVMRGQKQVPLKAEVFSEEIILNFNLLAANL
jgi:hypothetical protein